MVPEESGELSELLMHAARAQRRRWRELLEPWDLSPHQVRALRVVGDADGTRVSALAEALRIAPRSATEVADGLEERGLVERAADPADRRAVLLRLTDGTELPADLVVYATGYGSMNGWAADLISPEVADKVGKVWGLGSDTTKDPGPWEGEQRNMWKPTQQEALWMHGGNLHQSRFHSLYLALQLKARAEGIPTPVYGLQGVHHLN